MSDEPTLSLADHLRRVTRQGTQPLPEDDAFALALALARGLAAAHGETPPRFPDIDPELVAMDDAGQPRLAAAGAGEPDVVEVLFRLGALLCSLLGSERPEISWRLDGPPLPDCANLGRRAALAALCAPARHERPATAAEAVLLLEAAVQSGPPASAWPLFRGDVARSGACAARAGSLTGIEHAWSLPLGSVVASPAVAGDLVVAAALDGRLVFADARSGRLVHTVPLGVAIESPPTVTEDAILLGTDGGEVVSVARATAKLGKRIKAGRMVRSGPLLMGGLCVVGTIDAKAGGTLCAVDPRTGRTAWSRPLGAVFASPASDGTLVVVGSDDGSLRAFAHDGTPRWSLALAGKVRASAALADGRAIVGDFGGRVTAVDLATGQAAWTQQVGHPVYSSACLAHGLAVFGCNDGHVHGLDAATGEPRFQFATRGPVIGSAVAVADAFVVGSTDGELYAFDAAGRIRARRLVAPDGIQGSLAVAHGLLLCPSAQGLHAYRWTA